MERTLLIVDDELGIRELLRECLEDEGYSVRLAENALEADKLVKEHKFDLILMDVWLPDMDGVSLFKRFLSNGISTPVIMMSGHASITSALEAIRIGARDFLEKPLSLSKLLPLVEKHALKGQMVSDHGFEEITEIITLDLNKELKIIKESLERRYFLYHLSQNRNNITKVAEASGVDRAHLYRKFKTLGIKIK